LEASLLTFDILHLVGVNDLEFVHDLVMTRIKVNPYWVLLGLELEEDPVRTGYRDPSMEHPVSVVDGDLLDILLNILHILAIGISQTTLQPHPHLIHDLFHLAPDLVEHAFLLLSSRLYLDFGQGRPIGLVDSWISLTGSTADRQQLIRSGIS
jgi:hypothetical protein